MRRCPRLALPPRLSLKLAPCWARFSTWPRSNWRDVSPTLARISTRLARRSTRCSPDKRAFEASSSPGVIAAILRGETPSLLAVRPDLPPALERIRPHVSAEGSGGALCEHARRGDGPSVGAG